MAAGGHQTSDREVECSHGDTAVDEQGATAKLVDKAQGYGRSDEEYNILDGRRDEIDVPGQTGHLEDVDNVVHHDVSAKELLPDLGSESSAVGLQDQLPAHDSRIIDNLNVRSPSPHVWPE